MRESFRVGDSVTGTVVRVEQHFAELLIGKAKGWLHISQAGDRFLKAPLSDHLSVGQLICVALMRYDSSRHGWEVSRKVQAQREIFDRTGLKRAQQVFATITAATVSGCDFDIDGIRARLIPKRPWTAYQVLLESGELRTGAQLEVVVEKWDSSLGSLRVRLPSPILPSSLTEVFNACVVFIRPNYIKKKHVLRSTVYGRVEKIGLVRVCVDDLVDIEKTLPLGSVIRVHLKPDKDEDSSRGMISAEIHRDDAVFTVPPDLIDEVTTATITQTRPKDVRCLLRDHVVGFLTQDAVSKDIGLSLDHHFRPGDKVEIKVVGKAANPERGLELHFVRKTADVEPADPDSASVPIDLTAVRITKKSNSFQRDNSFRDAVLELFACKCAICGINYNVGVSSPMQAAHIVPFNKRGASIPSNGLCLCPLHHWAFDAGYIAIDGDFVIFAAQEILTTAGKSSGSWISDYHGKRAHSISAKTTNQKALEWHMQNIFKG